MLSRKEKADSTRNALSVLQRFRFLFNLPANIEKNIRKVSKTLFFLNNSFFEFVLCENYTCYLYFREIMKLSLMIMQELDLCFMIQK